RRRTGDRLRGRRRSTARGSWAPPRDEDTGRRWPRPDRDDTAADGGRVPAAREQDGRGTLWLVPGHLGDVRDLGPRTVEVLGRAAIWLVEPGSERAVARTAQLLSLTPPRMLPLRDGPQEDDALDAILRALDD